MVSNFALTIGVDPGFSIIVPINRMKSRFFGFIGCPPPRPSDPPVPLDKSYEIKSRQISPLGFQLFCIYQISRHFCRAHEINFIFDVNLSSSNFCRIKRCFYEEIIFKTSQHSSRIRTAHLPTVRGGGRAQQNTPSKQYDTRF